MNCDFADFEDVEMWKNVWPKWMGPPRHSSLRVRAMCVHDPLLKPPIYNKFMTN